MNKKGFTLVELLATIVLLCIITLLATFTINKSVKDAKNRSHNSQVDTILSAGISYTNKEDAITLDNINGYKIYLKALSDGGYLDKIIKDPLNGKMINMTSSYIEIKISNSVNLNNSDIKNYKYNGKYVYELHIVYE